MRSWIAVFCLMSMSLTAFADVQFTLGGPRNFTKAADGVVLSGETAIIVFANLNFPAAHKDGFLTKLLDLGNGSSLNCSVADTTDYRTQLLSAECIIETKK